MKIVNYYSILFTQTEELINAEICLFIQKSVNSEKILQMSVISIEGMEFYAYHGCFKEEAIIGTRFICDFHYKLKTSQAEQSDDLSETVNYQTVYKLIKTEMDIKSNLIEHVARRILVVVSSTFPQINEASIKISKLNPHLGGKIRNVSINLSTLDL